MKSYVIYNLDGEILRCGAVSDNSFSDIQDASTEFELLVDWPIDVENYKVVDKTLVLKPDEELVSESQNMDLVLFRQQRDGMLSASDWTQSPDSPLSDTKKSEWATYRQQLRDLPSTTTDPSSPSWPQKPD
tara:strand:- start:877 stop:1269 length:393 start_codon:yes stop_codon:yes gene_type:complete